MERKKQNCLYWQRHDLVYRKSKECIYKNLLELAIDFSKFAEHKVNIQKWTIFLYTHHEQIKVRLIKKYIFNSTKDNEKT